MWSSKTSIDSGFVQTQALSSATKKFTLAVNFDEIAQLDQSGLKVTKLRPFVKEFFEQLQESFTIVLFSKLPKSQLSSILQEKSLSDHVHMLFSREELFGPQQMKGSLMQPQRMILIDRQPQSKFEENLISLPSWNDNKDLCLIWIGSLLQNIGKMKIDDIRVALLEQKSLLSS